MEIFKERIKTLRLEHGMSQYTLAKKIKSSQKIIDYWEKGESEPKANFIVALADCFGVTCDYLLGREDDFGNVNVNSDLTDNEKLLITAFNNASTSEKETLLNFAKYLMSKQ